MTQVLDRLYRQGPFNQDHVNQDHGRQPDWLPARSQAWLVEADITRDHWVGLWVWMSAAPIVTAVAWFTLGGWGVAAALAMIVLLPVGVVIRWSGRRTRRLIRALPELVDMVSRSLRSGASLHQALGEASANAPRVVAGEIHFILRGVEQGRSIVHALGGWPERVPCHEVRVVAAALAMVSENEAGSTRALDGVAQTLRDRAMVSAEIAALTAQSSASLRAMVLLPLGFLAIDALGDAQVLRFLFGQSAGRVCLASGVGLNLLGWFWMRSLVRRKLPG